MIFDDTDAARIVDSHREQQISPLRNGLRARCGTCVALIAPFAAFISFLLIADIDSPTKGVMNIVPESAKPALKIA